MPNVLELLWRTGRKVFRTIYAQVDPVASDDDILDRDDGHAGDSSRGMRGAQPSLELDISVKFAFADPPYPGQAKKHYGTHPDYAGEVDHRALVEQLATYDGWALSTAMKSFVSVAKLLPDDILTLAWIKPIAPPMGDHRHYSWEPVFLRPVRRPGPGYVKSHLILSPPMFTFRPKPDSHVIGEKPEGFAHWVFENAGLVADDVMVDLFPGSGAVGRAWESWRTGRAQAGVAG